MTDERPRPGESPTETAVRLADEKAASVAGPAPDEVVVGADTIVVLDGRPLGKPTDEHEARTMLRELRGRGHEVVTGIALLAAGGKRYRGAVRTEVRLRAYSDDALGRYVASGRALDKAGAYAIQDRDFGPVERMAGCYLNVVGLPLCEARRGLRALGWPLTEACDEPPCGWCLLGQAALAEAEASAS